MLTFMYFSNENCSVCVADRERLAALSERTGIPVREGGAKERGQYLVFSAPTILLLDPQDRELHRESGFVDFDRLQQAAERMGYDTGTDTGTSREGGTARDPRGL